MPEKRGQNSRSQVELQIMLRLDRKVSGSNPERTLRFSRLQARDNDCTMQCAYYDACLSNLCNIVAEFTLIVNRAMWQLVLI